MHLAVFDPYTGGHHGLYIQHLLHHWISHNIEGQLDLLVPPDFLEVHKDLVQIIAHAPHKNIEVITLPLALKLKGDTQLDLVAFDLAQGKQLKNYVKQHNPTHLLLMYLDHLQFSLATLLRFKTDLHISGIYFRPSFHYAGLTKQHPSFRGRLSGLRKTIQLRLALRNPHLTSLFCLDPYVLPYVEPYTDRVKPVFLPDGIALDHPIQPGKEIINNWGVKDNRFVALLFGSLTARKGIYETLDALPLLPEDVQNRLAVVFAGPIHKGETHRFEASVSAARENCSVQIIVDNRFILDKEIQSLIKASNLILVTYQHHIGSSNVLIRAADAQIPVLGTDYGLVGEQIRRRRLGTALDATKPHIIAKGLQQHIQHPEQVSFDVEEAQRFAGENSAERFGTAIFSHL